MGRLIRRVRALLLSRRESRNLAEEIAFHREMKERELRERGVGEREIAAAAQRALGNDLLARERARDVWIAPWLQDIAQDVRFGLRMLVKERRFAVTAIVTLSLGIGVSNAAFTFVNATMFRDLPFDDADRLITIRTHDPRGFMAGVSYLDVLEFRQHATVFASFNAESSQSVSVSDKGRPAERLSGTFVTHGTFQTLGVTPILGRDFVSEDDRDGATPTLILGHGIWRARYGGDPAIVGRIVRVNDQPATVIGVMPEGFGYPYVADLWMPMAMAPNLQNATWTSTGFGVVGRLKPSTSLAQVRAEVETIAARTARDHPEVDKDRRLSVSTLKDGQLTNGAVPLMWALLGGGLVVLLVASANVANLQLARSWHRAREIAVRLAMGATRWRVVRQVLIECALIAGFGGVAGAYLSFVAFQAMASAFNVIEFGAPDRPRKPYWFDPSIDGVVWAFLAAAVLFASIFAGLIPALQLSKTGVNDVLKDGRLGGGTRVSRRWAALLMVGQLAVALALLCSGGLLARSFYDLYRTSPVIDTNGIITMRLTLPLLKYGEPAARRQFIRRLDERILNTPEFAESTIASDVPLQPLMAVSRTLAIDGAAPSPGQTPPKVVYISTGLRFFETLRFPVVRGRALSMEDARPGSEGAIVNQRFASVFFANGDPIGRRIRLLPPSAGESAAVPWLTIVGIVPTLPDFLPNRPDDIVVYAPLLAESAPPARVIRDGASVFESRRRERAAG